MVEDKCNSHGGSGAWVARYIAERARDPKGTCLRFVVVGTADPVQ